MALLPLAILLSALLLLARAQPAYAHGGVDSGQNIWFAWNLTPETIFAVSVVGWFYVRGLRRWSRPHHPVSRWQQVSFSLGLAAIFVAVQSPIDALAEHLFFVHQVQHLLLRVIGPVLLFLGAPLTPLLRGVPASLRRGVVRPVVKNRVVRRAYDY